MKESPSPFPWPMLGLAFSLLFPSLGVIQKYLGNVSVLIYLATASVMLLTAYRNLLPWFASEVTEKQAAVLFVVTFLLLIIVFVVVYPIANSGTLGRGSDTDEGFNIAVSELLHGRNPYFLRTYLGNPLVQMPGSVLLATPFVLLGNSAYQNFFWLVIFFLILKMNLKTWRLTVLLMWAVLILCPTILQQVVAGSDYGVNAIYNFAFTWLVIHWVPQKKVSIGKKMTAAILFGIGLSCRANFLLLLPLVFSALLQNSGWKPAFGYISLALLAFCTVTFPFYVWAPEAFVPFSAQFGRLGQFGEALPFAGTIIPFLGALIAVALSFNRMDKTGTVLFRNSALVQGFLVLCGVLLSSAHSGTPDFGWASYSLFFLFFGIFASSTKLVETMKWK